MSLSFEAVFEENKEKDDVKELLLFTLEGNTDACLVVDNTFVEKLGTMNAMLSAVSRDLINKAVTIKFKDDGTKGYIYITDSATFVRSSFNVVSSTHIELFRSDLFLTIESDRFYKVLKMLPAGQKYIVIRNYSILIKFPGGEISLELLNYDKSKGHSKLDFSFWNKPSDLTFPKDVFDDALDYMKSSIKSTVRMPSEVVFADGHISLIDKNRKLFYALTPHLKEGTKFSLFPNDITKIAGFFTVGKEVKVTFISKENICFFTEEDYYIVQFLYEPRSPLLFDQIPTESFLTSKLLSSFLASSLNVLLFLIEDVTLQVTFNMDAKQLMLKVVNTKGAESWFQIPLISTSGESLSFKLDPKILLFVVKAFKSESISIDIFKNRDSGYVVYFYDALNRKKMLLFLHVPR